VAENTRGEAIADIPVFRVEGVIETEDTIDGLLRMERGVVKIAAAPSSPSKSVWKNIVKVLLRETDF